MRSWETVANHFTQNTKRSLHKRIHKISISLNLYPCSIRIKNIHLIGFRESEVSIGINHDLLSHTYRRTKEILEFFHLYEAIYSLTYVYDSI